MKKNLIILGSTGSIGVSTLAVLRHQLNLSNDCLVTNVNITQHSADLMLYSKAYDYQIFGLFAYQSVDKLIEQAIEFRPRYCGLYDQDLAQIFTDKLNVKLTELKLDREQFFKQTTLVFGKEEIEQIIIDPQVDTVVGAIVGFAGLESSLLSLEHNKTLLLANKESLVAGGYLIREILKTHSQTKLIPVDSEHNAIFQTLPNEIQQNVCNCDLTASGVNKILLTGSGGPFLNLPLADFKNITVEQALKHPNWAMGSKITIDSSTMFNKGLELIEACVLFNCEPSKVRAVIHPQSIVHSGVEYLDGSLLVQMGPTNMCVPIAYALNYPYRASSSLENLDLFKLQGLTFKEVDLERYPNFKLTMDIYGLGFSYTCALNAANEVSVSNFLCKTISYLDIYYFNAKTIELIQGMNLSLEQNYQNIKYIDQLARDLCQTAINQKYNYLPNH